MLQKWFSEIIIYNREMTASPNYQPLKVLISPQLLATQRISKIVKDQQLPYDVQSKVNTHKPYVRLH